MLADVIRQAASVTWFATVSHPAKPKGWDIIWGAQVDPRVVRLTDDGEITDVAVASYLAKYATKSAEPVGVPRGRITAENASVYADSRTHQGRLITACLKLGTPASRPRWTCTAISTRATWTAMPTVSMTLPGTLVRPKCGQMTRMRMTTIRGQVRDLVFWWRARRDPSLLIRREAQVIRAV